MGRKCSQNTDPPDPAPLDSCMQPGRGDAVQVVAPFCVSTIQRLQADCLSGMLASKAPGKRGQGAGQESWHAASSRVSCSLAWAIQPRCCSWGISTQSSSETWQR